MTKKHARTVPSEFIHYVPLMPPRISIPNGIISAKMASMIAKQRSARLHLFQSETQSCIV
jgi:hypothetical protein